VAGSFDELIRQWQGLPAPRHALGCAVGASTLQSALTDWMRLHWGLSVFWLQAAASMCGVRNRYADPQQLGADRWACALGAHALFPQRDLVIVSAGTALVVDVLNAQGEFLGGTISPGYRLMKQALATQTARLPLAQGARVAFPDNTADAIESGCINALCGAIDAMRQPGCEIVLTGGDAALLAACLNRPTCVVDNLAIRGLEALAKESGQ
jgi:type III pantothenate kinase